jgi:DNA-binding ferritin-like protein
MHAFNIPSSFGAAIPLAQPQVQHFSTPLTDAQGMPIGQMDVIKESVPMMVAAPAEGPNQNTKEELVCAMICMAAFVSELRTQAHLVHLNYTGPEFLSVHKFLKDQYEKHVEQFDRISEMTRSLDYYMPMCSVGLSESACDFEHCKTYNGKEMLTTYKTNLESAGMKAKCLGKNAKVADASDAENLAADLVEDMFKDVYMLNSMLRPA